MSLYNLRTVGTAYMIAKFDSDFNIESTYTLTASRNGHFDCDCPAGSRSVVTKPCRHRLMLPALLPAVDTDRFYDFDTKQFCEPLGDLVGEALRTDSPETCDCLTEDECDNRKDCAVDAYEASMNKPIEDEASPSPVEPSEIIAEAVVRQVLGPTIRRR